MVTGAAQMTMVKGEALKKSSENSQKNS